MAYSLEGTNIGLIKPGSAFDYFFTFRKACIRWEFATSEVQSHHEQIDQGFSTFSLLVARMMATKLMTAASASCGMFGRCRMANPSCSVIVSNPSYRLLDHIPTNCHNPQHAPWHLRRSW